ncbi:hypothetical protein QUA86_34380 [Microcoleus sp. F6_B6]
MSILKVSVLTASAFTLWLAPPFVLSKKIPLHNFTTGLALLGSFACCFEARRVAVKLSQVEEFEAMKEAAINADVADELATEIYVSEQQRRIEAEAILNGQPEREETVEALKRAWLLDCAEPSEPSSELAEPTVQAVQPPNQPEDSTLAKDEERFTSLNLDRNQALTLIKKLRVELNQTQTIEKLWECKKGGSEAWKRAYAQFKSLMGEGDKEK